MSAKGDPAVVSGRNRRLGAGWVLWLAYLSLIVINPHFAFGGWTRREFDNASFESLAPRAVILVALLMVLLARRSAGIRGWLPASNAAAVLAITWFIVGPHLGLASPASLVVLLSFSAFATVRMHRWTRAQTPSLAG